ncbi:MAG: radical SAM protein [Enterocloster sp.]
MKKQKIWLTSQCNYQCFYCTEYGRGEEPASLEEIVRECEKAAAQGFDAVELGGGEPLLYLELTEAVCRIRQIKGIRHISVFTNGSLVKERMDELKKAGMDGINLHMDVPDASTYARITGKSRILNDILDVIWSAGAKGIALTITVCLHRESKAYLSVMAGLAKKFDITVCFAEIPEYSRECGLDEAAVVTILRRSFKDLKKDERGYYISSELKGKIQFGEYCF